MRIGAIDIGTNSTRLLVVDLAPGDEPRWVHRTVVVTGLGRGVDATGRLSEEAQARTLAALEKYGRALHEHGVDRARAVATSASRDAVNTDAFLDRAAAVLGFRPEVISGEHEARLSFRGATQALTLDDSVLVIDPGGGSTEFVFGAGEPQYLVSTDIGSVRLTERVLKDRPVKPGQIAAAAAEVGRAFAAVSLPAVPATVVGVGGTYASLAAIALGLDVYDPDVVHGTVLADDRLDDMVGMLSSLTVDETRRIPSLEPARAPYILAGALLCCEALRTAGRNDVTVSENDILLGVALETRESGG